MGNLCDYCINRESCKKCDKGWHDKFIPSDDVKKYFNHGYVGVRGIKGYVWHFDTTNEHLKPTHSITIGGTNYCPYCGEEMYLIQNMETLAKEGYCCICEGARAELVYEEKRKKLESDYQQKLHELQSEYSGVLSFKAEKLLEIKQKREKELLGFRSGHINHFSTLNGKSYTDIKQITD